ncbi:MAG: flagellar filament capping protein FliD [Deltaproteobacteria bacterium]|nr:flagellar filament capping protein FliD [Deltaproteobacteria bacterium]MDZ4342516.1 flagellar filament capping protein FliD [Candidatus Binatia bacterium]
MANVQFGGLITGLDVKSLIAGLIKAEHRSVDILQNQKVRYQAQDGVLTAVVSALGKLKSAAQGLSLPTDFTKRSAVSSDTSVLTATADSTAETGSNSIVVDRLAAARIVKSTSFTSASDAIGTGTLTITVDGTSTAITVDATNNTLAGLKSAINSSGAAVAASIVNAGTSASPDYRLVVQSKQTGTINAATISGTLAGGADPFAGGGEEVQAAADALFSVNGLTITRSSNTVSDVVTGVTVVLLQEGDRDGVVESTDASAKVTVSVDSTAMKSSIKDLADSFNTVNKIVNDQFTLNPDTKRQGALAGDASLRGVIARLRNQLSAASQSDGGFRYLSDIGIKFQKDGSLTLDEAKLSSALEEDPTGVSNLFTLVQNGIGKRIPDSIDDYVSSVDGTLTFRQKGLRTSIDNIDKKVAREESRIAAMDERLTKQFSALEQMVSQLKAQGDYLSQQMTALQRR